MTAATNDTLAQLWGSLRKMGGNNGMPPELMKAINQATGLVWYDLEPYAKLLFPVITPLRNEIPRVKGDGGTAAHWISITGVNINNVNISLGEGQRGGSVTTQVTQNLATYKSFGLDDSVTFEADLAAENFDDAKRLAVDNLLRATMIGEEKRILGGNTSLQLGLTPSPTLSDVGTGGTLVFNTQFSVIAVGLSFDGFMNDTLASGILAQVTRTNTDGSVITYGGGSAQKSVQTLITTANDSNSTHSIRAVLPQTGNAQTQPGAVAWAWFWGPSGSEKLGAITTVNSLLITALATGTQLASALPASDNSTDAYAFDGIITMIENVANGAQIYTLSAPTGSAIGTGSTLTADGAGGIVEIDLVLKAFWDVSRLSPQVILVNSQELKNINNKVIAGGAAPLFRFMIDNGGAATAASLEATAGTVVGNYLNKYTMAGGQLIKVLLHPNVPPGTIIFYSRQIPYPLSNVRNLLQMKMRRDYFQIEWPIVRPAYEFSVWANGVLQNFFMPSFGTLNNVGNG